MKRKICPRCGSENIDWRIPQLWSMWDCKNCKYTGPVIEADEKLIEEIKADWKVHKEKYIKSETIDYNNHDEDDLTDEEMDAKLKKLNL